MTEPKSGQSRRSEAVSAMAAAMISAFGDRAGAIVKRQLRDATGDIAETWGAILRIIEQSTEEGVMPLRD